jgi:hypothetical protein
MAVGSALLKEHHFSQTIEHTGTIFQMCFDMVDFCKSLLRASVEFREFISSQLLTFNRMQTLAFFAITNNALDVPRRGSTVTASTTDCVVITDTIDVILGTGKKMRLAAQNTLVDFRNCRSVDVRGSLPFNPDWFSNLQPFVDFFNRFTPENDFDELLYLSSLQEFLCSPFFRARFSVRSFPTTIEPENHPSPMHRFISFYLFLPNEKLPEFQLASVYHKSSIRNDWSLIVTEKEDVYSSPLPTAQYAAVQLKFEHPVLVTVLSMLNQQSICQRFGPFQIASEMSLEVSPEKVDLTNSDLEIHRLHLLSSSLLVFLKIESKLGQLIRFRITPELRNRIELLPIKTADSISSPFEFTTFPMGSLFTDSFLKSLSDFVRNAFWKSICLRLLPEIELDLSFLVRLVHALLCDSAPITEIVRVEFVGIAVRTINLAGILSRVPKGEFVDRFLNEFELFMSDPDKHGIWRNNTAVCLVAENDICRSCVIFGERLAVIGKTAIESPFAGMALPMDQLARSGIELVRFARNIVHVIITLGQREKLDRVKEIVQKGIEMGSIVLRSSDIYTIDHFITKLLAKIETSKGR